MDNYRLQMAMEQRLIEISFEFPPLTFFQLFVYGVANNVSFLSLFSQAYLHHYFLYYKESQQNAKDLPSVEHVAKSSTEF